MIELAPIDIIAEQDFQQRTANGLLVPMHAQEGLRVIDCGDMRPLTEGTADLRRDTHGSDVVPARYFGGSGGLALTALVTLAAQTDERVIANFVDEYSPQAFTDFAADLSGRAHTQRDGLEINQHSAVANEGNETGLAEDHIHEDTPLGCKLLELMGRVVAIAGDESALAASSRITSMIGQELPLEEVREGARILGKYLPPNFSITRSALRTTMTESPHHTPLAILDSSEIPITETAVVIDLGKYRSSARAHAGAGIPRYHHTPAIASELIPGLLQEYRLDPQLLKASGLLIGSATRDGLSGAETPRALRVEVIPPEYGVAA